MEKTDGLSARLMLVLADLIEIAAAIPPENTAAEFDETVTEVFYRDWPTIRSWAESVWQGNHPCLQPGIAPNRLSLRAQSAR